MDELFQEYFDRRSEARNRLTLTKATITEVCTAGMGDRVCVDLCSLMRPGEGLLVCFFSLGYIFSFSYCLCYLILALVSSIFFGSYIDICTCNCFRLDPMHGVFFLFTLSAWKLIT